MESADEGDAEYESESEAAESGSAGDEDEDEDESNVPNSDDESDISKANPGWADAMQKILRTKKPKRKKTIVLSKAKRLCDVVPKEKKETPSFQVDGENATVAPVTAEILDSSNVSKDKKEKEEEHSRRKRREVDLGIRVKPTVLDREREKTLQKIATKYVSVSGFRFH